MTDQPLVSIIIRTKNEERWIGACLRAVSRQSYRNFEVILVDNDSTDRTVVKALQFDVRLERIEQFLPGKAINQGIRASKGQVLVCLSGHCIPTNEHWLLNLVNDLSDPNVAGVYGRQEPLSFSSPFDKRDLMIVFGLDRKIQERDSFFHNANSAFRRDTWDRFPFDEAVTNIEDRVWGKAVIDAGMKIIYEPTASVYHYHGIHQNLDPKRAAKVVGIMEQIDGPAAGGKIAHEETEAVALIPVKGDARMINGRPLLERTIAHAMDSPHVKELFVATDSEKTAELARSLGARVPELRPPELSESFVGIGEVLQWGQEMIERHASVPDVVVILEETHPFRPVNLIGSLIELLVEKGYDSVVAAKNEGRRIWIERDGVTSQIGETDLAPRQYKDHRAFVGLFGLGCATHPTLLRSGDPLGSRVGIYEVSDPFAAVELRDDLSLEVAAALLARSDAAIALGEPE